MEHIALTMFLRFFFRKIIKTYNRQLNSSRVDLLVEDGRNDHHNRYGERLDALIRADRVELQ